MKKNCLSLLEVSDIIFDLIPEDVQKKYKKTIDKKTLTLKEQFIDYYEKGNWNFSKFSSDEKDLAKIITLTILKNNMEKIKSKDNFHVGVFCFLFI